MKLRRLLAVGVGSAALVALGPSAAYAGEVTGNGGTTAGPAHANSICVYSGLNDDTVEERGRTQSYGQLVRQGLKEFLPSPGDACNPTRGFEE